MKVDLAGPHVCDRKNKRGPRLTNEQGKYIVRELFDTLLPRRRSTIALLASPQRPQ